MAMRAGAGAVPQPHQRVPARRRIVRMMRCSGHGHGHQVPVQVPLAPGQGSCNAVAAPQPHQPHLGAAERAPKAPLRRAL